jgi:hypothetical protein
MAGESADADEKAEDFIVNVLPGLIEEYAAEDIYNADETGLFFKHRLDKTYGFSNEKWHGGNKSRVLIKKYIQAAMDFSHLRSIIRNARYSNGPFRVYYKEIVLFIFGSDEIRTLCIRSSLAAILFDLLQ